MNPIVVEGVIYLVAAVSRQAHADSLVNLCVGTAGFITNVLGNVLVGRKSEHGWWVRILSNGLWFAYSWQTMTIPLAANAIVFAGINIFYWHKWRKEIR